MSQQMAMPDLLALDGSDTQLKITLRPDHYDFAKTQNALPLAQSEYELACKNYPIVFIATDAQGNTLQSVVLTSFQAQDNAFVQSSGAWEPFCYIPAWVKRHPFHLGFDEKTQQPLVYVDKQYPGLSRSDGMAFFEAGAPSAYLTQLVHALRTLQVELDQTQQWVMRLKNQGLLKPQSIQLTDGDHSESLAGIWVVDMDKVAALEDAEIAQMYHNGTLALIEQHRLSLANLDILAQRLSARGQ